ncbi:MAG: hypothetical protein LC733_13815 [Actinobacteria bacterium]|nr:hypothetical protein [Actinomycetota bacterium]
MLTLVVGLFALALVVLAGIMVAGQRKGDRASVMLAGRTMLAVLVAFIVAAVLVWTLFLSQIHIG